MEEGEGLGRHRNMFFWFCTVFGCRCLFLVFVFVYGAVLLHREVRGERKKGGDFIRGERKRGGRHGGKRTETTPQEIPASGPRGSSQNYEMRAFLSFSSPRNEKFPFAYI